MADVERYVGAVDKEVREYNQSLMKMEDVLLELTVENEKLKRSTVGTPKTPRRASAKVRKKVECEDDGITDETQMVNDTTHKAPPQPTTSTTFTQTYETAFVPCEACAAMQANVMKLGTSVIDICESHGLPCSLAKQKKLMKNTTMTMNDVVRWCTEEERDIAKVNKYMGDIHNQLAPLQTQLTQTQTTNKTLTEQLNTTTADRDKLRSRVDASEEECSRVRRKVEDLEKRVKLVEGNNVQLKGENDILKDSCTRLTEDVDKYENSVQVLEDGMKNLTSQLGSHKSTSENFAKLEHRLKETLLKVDETETKLKESQEECNKVKADKKVILEHDQGLQVKQSNLLSRIEKLDETCKDLVTQLGENEEEIENVTQENTRHLEESKQLKEERSMHVQRIQQLERELKTSVPPRDEQVTNTTNTHHKLIKKIVVIKKDKANS
jgi:peptidoglycan hydrolase CwlO-like protein